MDKRRQEFLNGWGLGGITMYDSAVDVPRIKIVFK